MNIRHDNVERAHGNIKNLDIIITIHQAWTQIDLAQPGEIPNIQNTYIDRDRFGQNV